MPIGVYRIVAVAAGILCVVCLFMWATMPKAGLRNSWTLPLLVLLAGVGCYASGNHSITMRDQELLRTVSKSYPKLKIARVWEDGGKVAYYRKAATSPGRCSGELATLSNGSIEIVYLGHSPGCQQALIESE